MKIDLNELEADDPNLPPFITRCTMPKDNDQRRREFDAIFPIFAKLNLRSFKQQAAA